MNDLIGKIILERNKTVDNLILGEIQKIATENGFDTKVVLNEKAIVSALEKQMPKKPTPHKGEIDKIRIGNGSWGKGTTIYKCPNCEEFISRTSKHCNQCGQALDWSDTE